MNNNNFDDTYTTQYNLPSKPFRYVSEEEKNAEIYKQRMEYYLDYSQKRMDKYIAESTPYIFGLGSEPECVETAKVLSAYFKEARECKHSPEQILNTILEHDLPSTVKGTKFKPYYRIALFGLAQFFGGEVVITKAWTKAIKNRKAQESTVKSSKTDLSKDILADLKPLPIPKKSEELMLIERGIVEMKKFQKSYIPFMSRGNNEDSAAAGRILRYLESGKPYAHLSLKGDVQKGIVEAAYGEGNKKFSRDFLTALNSLATEAIVKGVRGRIERLSKQSSTDTFPPSR